MSLTPGPTVELICPLTIDWSSETTFGSFTNTRKLSFTRSGTRASAVADASIRIGAGTFGSRRAGDRLTDHHVVGSWHHVVGSVHHHVVGSGHHHMVGSVHHVVGSGTTTWWAQCTTTWAPFCSLSRGQRGVTLIKAPPPTQLSSPTSPRVGEVTSVRK
ncbi:unnamed protein product [Lampetra fluviatilis]